MHGTNHPPPEIIKCNKLGPYPKSKQEIIAIAKTDG